MIQVWTDFSYDVNASDNVAIDTYWLDDTTNFEIDGNGNHFIVMTNGDEKHKINKDGDHDVLFVSKDGSKKTFEIILTDDDEIVWIDKKGNKTVEIIKSGGGSDMIFISDGDDLYIVINGKESSKEEMEKLGNDKIEKIDVIKGDAATKKYGDKAKNGVIEITTKKE